MRLVAGILCPFCGRELKPFDVMAIEGGVAELICECGRDILKINPASEDR